MKKPQILALTTLLALASSTFAVPQLRLSDGTTTITVTDGDANDKATDPGVVYYNGPVGPKWIIDITVGLTKPTEGSPAEPYMDLSQYAVSSDAADLTVQMTETDFTAASGAFDAEVGGNTDGVASFSYYLDSNNTPFGTNTPLASFNNLTTVVGSSNGTYTITAPYSMTVAAKIHHNGLGTTGFDSQLMLTPSTYQPPTIECAGDRDLGCNPTTIPGCDTASVTVNAACGVSNVTCAAAGPDTVTGCLHERDLVYTVTDNCGQTATCTQHIFWNEDTTAPSFTSCPGDMALGCNPTNVPDCDLTLVSATDNCGRAVVTCGKVDETNGCNYTRTITYVASDTCGNKATCVQHVTWTVDTTAPQFTKCAEDMALGCNPASIPDCDVTLVSATDECGTPAITCSKLDSADGCNHTRSITYVATDACGNSSSCTQQITWTEDKTAPQFTTCASDMALGCNPASIPDCDTTQVAASDNCSTPTISCSKSDSVDGCNHTRTITYVATDACGNSSSCVQHITWTEDKVAPSFTTCAADRNLGCNPTTVPGCDVTQVVATDNCGTPTVTCSSVDSSSGCSNTRTITYVATDACGNSASCVQHITWTVSTVKPSFTSVPGDITLGCNPAPGSIPTSQIGSVAATDTCSTPSVTSSYVDSSSGCSRTRTITYVATDACGNSASAVQHINWTVNTTAPSFTKVPGNIALGCNPTTIPGVNTNSTNVAATDDCGVVTMTGSYVDASNGCDRTRTITYVATDGCGNSSSKQQVITWTVNTGAPTFTYVPGNMTVSSDCGQSCAKVTYTAAATDNCGTPTITFSPASGSCLPVGTNVVTVTATDGCGNQASRTFTVIVVPNYSGCYVTYTPGGWGAPPNGNNVATLLQKTFTSMYGSAFKVGGTYTITLTSQLAIQNFLPSGGTPSVLTKNYSNPLSTSAGEFASQVTALKLNCDYSNKGLFKVGLTSLHVAPGKTLAGYTVTQVLALAQTVLGGKTSALPAGVTVSSLTTLLSGINGNYDGGLTDNGYLVP
jgi:hypothetical protein